MRVFNCTRCLLAVALVWAMGNLPSPATADDDNNKQAAGGAAPAKETGKDTAKDAAKPPSKNAIATAFALPKGTTLNPKQQAAYDQLKTDKEDELRQAIDDLQNSKSGVTAAAAKKVRDLRAAIRQKINDILYGKLAASGSSGSNSGSGSSEGYYVPYGGYQGYAYPAYGGYYPYWAYGYNPYYGYNPRWRNARNGNSSGTSNGKSTGYSAPPSRPASNSAAGGKK